MSASRPAAGATSVPAALLSRIRLAAGLTWRASRLRLVAVVLLTILAGGCPVAVAWLTKWVLDQVTGAGDASQITTALVLFAVVGLLAAAVPHLVTYLEAQLRRAVRRRVLDQLFGAIRAFPGLARFEDPAFHDRLRLARNAGESAPQQIIGAGVTLLQAGVSVSGFVVTLFALNPVLAVAVVASAVPAAAAELALSRRRAALAWTTSHGMRRSLFYGNLQTDVRAAKELRLFGAGALLHRRMLTELRDVDHAEQRLDARTLRIQSGLALLSALMPAAALAYAAYAVLRGSLSVGDIAMLLSAVVLVQAAIGQVGGQIAAGHQALLLLGHYEAVLTAPPDVPLASQPRPLPVLAEGIRLHDVWFRYGDDQPWVLRGVDLFIPHGRATALVGVNGAGKSTMVKLLCRFYDPIRGRITWDGVDIREVGIEEYRDRISGVFQDYMCYDLPGRENIGIAEPAAFNDLPAIRRAASEADIDGYLSNLPRSYDTMLSRIFFADEPDDEATGVVLSGGQWQRVALARAFLRERRDLLILDEPSAGLDAEAEYAVHEKLRRRRTGATSLLISHRMSAVRAADHIVVLSGGRITESGDHAELMRVGGEYAKLFTLQGAGYQADDPSLPVPAAQ